MPSVIPCVPSCCSTPQTVNTQGSQGNSAITLTTATFAIAAPGTIAVLDSSWMTVGENLWIGTLAGGANFLVTGVPNATHVTLTSLGFSGDVTGTMPSGAIVASGVGNLSSGGIVTPVSIANGGTGSATKGAAQSALGLGQINAFYYADALAAAFTNAFAAKGGALTLSESGSCLVICVITVDFIGTTFAAQRTMTFKLRDITAGSDLANSTINRKTALVTTSSLTSVDYTIVTVLTSVATHQIQLFAMVDTVASAGTHQINAIQMTPIYLAIA